MCTVSAIIDNFGQRHQQVLNPQIWPNSGQAFALGVTRAEFDALKREVEQLRELLKAAKKFDDATGQPDCEQAEKVALLKRIAELVGVDISDALQA